MATTNSLGMSNKCSRKIIACIDYSSELVMSSVSLLGVLGNW